MTMRNIDGADAAPSTLLGKLARLRGGRGQGAAQKAMEAGRPALTSGADSITLSPEARRQERLHADLTAAREGLAALPDVRQERVAQARARLEAGLYGTAEVRGTVATRLGAVIRKLEDLIGQRCSRYSG